MSECAALDPELPTRQGDIFRAASALQIPLSAPLGVVLTADCDFAQTKTGPFLTCLPIIPMSQYVAEVWAASKLSRRYAGDMKSAIEYFSSKHLAINPNASGFTEPRLLSWVEHTSIEAIISELRVESDGDQKILRSHVFTLLEHQKATRGDHAFSCLARIEGLKKSDAPNALRQQAKNELKSNLPQDCFFLSEIPELQEPGGYLVLLRHIFPLALGDIGASLQAFSMRQTRALRIARLAPTYKYALTQKFGSLFSRIAMPSEYESRQRDALDALPDIPLK